MPLNIAKIYLFLYAYYSLSFIQFYHFTIMQRDFRDIVNIGPRCVERFIDTTNAPEIKALDIELAGCSNLSGEYQVGRVNPPNHTLFYSLKGRGKVVTPSGEYALPPSTLIILPAHQSFEVRISENIQEIADNAQSSQWDIIWLNLSDTPLWQHLYRVKQPVQNDIDLTGLHHAMELLYIEDKSQHRLAVIPIIEQYLQRIATPVKGTHHTRLNALFSTVEKRLQFNWNIASLANLVHYSAPHLHRLCLLHFNRSPMQQVIHLRMARAKNLLISTQWPIAYIANYVGYSNVFTFSKRFKKSEGVPPSEYRERHHQK